MERYNKLTTDPSWKRLPLLAVALQKRSDPGVLNVLSDPERNPEQSRKSKKPVRQRIPRRRCLDMEEKLESGQKLQARKEGTRDRE